MPQSILRGVIQSALKKRHTNVRFTATAKRIKWTGSSGFMKRRIAEVVLRIEKKTLSQLRYYVREFGMTPLFDLLELTLCREKPDYSCRKLRWRIGALHRF